MRLSPGEAASAASIEAVPPLAPDDAGQDRSAAGPTAPGTRPDALMRAVGWWLPPMAVAVAAASTAMAIAGLTPDAASLPAAFVLGLVAVGAITVYAGFRPAVATALLCAAWLASPLKPGGTEQAVATAAAFVVPALGGAWLLARRVHRVRRPVTATATASSERGLLVLLVLAVVVPFALYAAIGAYAWRTVQAETAQRLERIARAAQEHASKVMDTNDLLLGRVIELVAGLGDAEIRLRERALHATLVAATERLPQLQSVWITDAQGRPLVSNRYLPVPHDRLDVSDRDFFVWHREGRGGLYVSQPGIGRVTLEPFFDTTRRRDDARGDFAGIVQASLRPSYFTDFYADLAQAEPGLVVTLTRRDGVLLARHPAAGPGVVAVDPAGPLLRRVAAGERGGLTTMRSGIDGVERLVAFRAVDHYPMVVAAGVQHTTLVAAWRRSMALLAGLVFPLASALVAAAWLALQRARRERLAVERMRREAGQRVRAEAALVKSQKLQALGQITGSVAHDFNNLLAVINNAAHVLRRRVAAGSEAAVTPSLDAIERSVRNGVHLTRQLLAFSRRQALQPVDLDLRDALPPMVELLRTSVGARVRLEVEVAPDVPAVRIDRADLELALLNLVLNARDAMPEGGRVRIGVRGEPAVGGHGPGVLIEVADSGTGIQPDLLERVFEPFFTTKPVSNGTGLGLSQVRAACEQAGGSVAIASRPGVGTVVSLRLPATVSSAPQAAPERADARIDASVLLVEDEDDVAETTRLLLEALGARVAAASAPMHALDVVQRRPGAFDVVLSDIVMPGAVNGLALARRLRTAPDAPPVVLMTGFSAELDAARAEGFAVVAKPCDPVLLAATLAQAVADAGRRPAAAAFDAGSDAGAGRAA